MEGNRNFIIRWFVIGQVLKIIMALCFGLWAAIEGSHIAKSCFFIAIGFVVFTFQAAQMGAIFSVTENGESASNRYFVLTYSLDLLAAIIIFGGLLAFLLI